MFKRSPKPLPKLIMIPHNGEYKIIPLPKKSTWLEVIMQNIIIGLALFFCGGFALYVISTVNAR